MGKIHDFVFGKAEPDAPSLLETARVGYVPLELRPSVIEVQCARCLEVVKEGHSPLCPHNAVAGANDATPQGSVEPLPEAKKKKLKFVHEKRQVKRSKKSKSRKKD